jgi:hypothetical protein
MKAEDLLIPNPKIRVNLIKKKKDFYHLSILKII